MGSYPKYSLKRDLLGIILSVIIFQKLQTMKLSSGRMAGFAWEGSGLRLAILIDNNFYLAVVKPAYKVTATDGRSPKAFPGF